MIPFGGEHVPCGLLLTLRKVLAAATTFRYEELDFFFANTYSQATASMQETDATKKYWYINRTLQGDINGYINIHPGEFSADIPTGDEVIILDPMRDETHLFTHELQELLDYINATYPKELPPEEYLLRWHLEQLLEKKGADHSDTLSRFRKEAETLRQCGSQLEVDIILGMLKRDYYDNYRLSLVDFSLCMLSLDIQLEMGGFAVEDVYSDPSSGLNLLLHTFKAIPQARNISLIANAHFTRAQAALKTAVTSTSMVQAAQSLRGSAHHYYSATVLGKAIVEQDIPHRLNYDIRMADEGWACSLSGVWELQFSTQPVNIYMEMLCTEISAGRKDFDFYFINRFSSYSRPYLTRTTATVLLAAAFIQCDQDVEANIATLLSTKDAIEASKASDSFDHWLIYQQLQLAYGKVNHIPQQTYYAHKAALCYIDNGLL